MAIAYVQSNSNLTASSVASISSTFSSSQTAGNSNYVGVVTGNSTQPTISDSKSNTYSLSASANLSSQGIFLWLFSAISIASGTSNQVTASTAVNTYMAIAISEYSAVGATLDGSAVSGTGTTGTALATSSLTTTNASDLLLAISCVGTGGTTTAGSGFTMRQTSTFFPQCNLEDDIVTATGTYTGTMTAGSSQTWCILMAAFKASTTTLNPSLTAGTIAVTGSVLPIYTSNSLAPLFANVGFTATSGVQLVYYSTSSGTLSVPAILTATFSPVNPNLTGTASVTGIANPILPILSPSVSGNINATGLTIPSLSLSVPGSIKTSGSFTPTFSPIFINFAGSISESGSIGIFGLGPIISGLINTSGGVNNAQLGTSVSGSVSVTGLVNPSLGIISTGIVSVSGVASPTLPNMILNVSGLQGMTGVINPALDPGLGISTSGMVSVSGAAFPTTTNININVSGALNVIGTVLTAPIFSANTSLINITCNVTTALSPPSFSGSFLISGSTVPAITPIFVSLSGAIGVTGGIPSGGKGLGMSLVGVYDFWGGGFC